MAGARQQWVPQGTAAEALTPNTFIVPDPGGADNTYVLPGAGSRFVVGVTDSSTSGPDAASEDVHAAIGDEVRCQAGNVVIVTTGAGGSVGGTSASTDAAGLAIAHVPGAGVHVLGTFLQTVAAGGEAELYLSASGL